MSFLRLTIHVPLVVPVVLLVLDELKAKHLIKKIKLITIYLRNNSRMPGSMLILTWVSIIFVIILQRAKAQSPASENYFDSNRAFTVILCIHAYLDRGYLPLLCTRIYNATEAVPITSRYYLQEYITLQKRYKN